MHLLLQSWSAHKQKAAILLVLIWHLAYILENEEKHNHSQEAAI